MWSHEHPFYGEEISRDEQQEKIEEILKKHKNEPADEELKKKIYDELMTEKHKGTVKIPFRVVLRQDRLGQYPDYVEVVLDSKV